MMRHSLAAILLTCFATPALAEAPKGCYARDYSAAHLAQNPDQHVAALRLNFHPDPSGLTVDVIGRFADQGRAAREGLGGEYFTQGAYCGARQGILTCQVECDGGSFSIRSLSEERLEISTDFFALGAGDGCETLSNLVELEGRVTTYRLSRSDAATCRGVD